MRLTRCARLRRMSVWSSLVVLAVAWHPAPVLAQAPGALFSDERPSPADRLTGTRLVVNNPIVLRSRTTTVNVQMLYAPAPPPTGWAAAAPAAARSVDLNLFSDVNLVAFFDHTETVAAANGSAWVGTVSGVEGSQVILAVADGVFTAAIDLPDRTFSVRRLPDSTYVVAELNRQAIPRDADPLVPPSDSSVAVAAAAATPDSGDTFDLLICYTTAAKNTAGGAPAMNALATASAAHVNAIYQASGIPARLRVVAVVEVAFAESGDIRKDLPAVTANANVQGLRDHYGADLVTLVTSWDPDFSGLAYVMGGASLSTAFAPNAYSVVIDNGGWSYIWALAHELSHNMGNQHEPGNNASSGGDSGGAYPYSLGYTDSTNKFYDIMSYGLNCTGCVQLNQFSSPVGTYKGIAVGTPTQDAARTITNTRTIVANFRTAFAPVLGSPTNLIVSSSGASVSLRWDAPTTGHPTGYVIQAGSEAGHSDLATIATGSTATTFAANDIANGVFYLRVFATDGVTISGPTNEAVLQVGACRVAPGTPGTLTATVAGSTLLLSWQLVTVANFFQPLATAYVVEAGSVSGLANLFNQEASMSPYFDQNGGTPAMTFTAAGVPAGTYFMRVRAKNACGTSAASNEAVVIIR